MAGAKITEAKIKQWKRKFGDVFLIEVPLDDSKQPKMAEGYFSKPNLETISAAGKYSDSDPIKSGMILYNNTKLEVDDEIDSNDEAKMSCIEKISDLFRVREAKIKKL